MRLSKPRQQPTKASTSVPGPYLCVVTMATATIAASATTALLSRGAGMKGAGSSQGARRREERTVHASGAARGLCFSLQLLFGCS